MLVLIWMAPPEVQEGLLVVVARLSAKTFAALTIAAVDLRLGGVLASLAQSLTAPAAASASAPAAAVTARAASHVACILANLAAHRSAGSGVNRVWVNGVGVGERGRWCGGLVFRHCPC
jgi:hypothetical protein